jgi:hypothetical protein
MTEGQEIPMPDNAAEIPYEEITSPDYSPLTATTFVRQDAGLIGSLLSGPCPRCGHHCDVPVVGSVFKGIPSLPGLRRKKGRQRAGDRAEPMICACVEEHAGRPAERTGCGAYWMLVVKDEPR